MASWLIRIDLSSGKSRGRRRAICSGLHARAHRRGCRRPCRRPFHGTTSLQTIAPLGTYDDAGQALLHVPPQLSIDRELRRLRPARGAIRMPLRRRRSVLEAAGARGGVAAQLPRDRRRRSGQPAGDLAYSMPLGAPELPVGERVKTMNVPARIVQESTNDCFYYGAATSARRGSSSLRPCPRSRRASRWRH